MDWDPYVYPEENNGDVIGFFMLANSINFAFRNFEGGGKFTSYYGGKREGSDGMWACLKKAWDEGTPILNAEYLSGISEKDMRRIFEGNMEIPMLQERLGIFREVGRVLLEKYDGSFCNLIVGNNRLFNDGEGIVERLVRDFPSFDDSWDYWGRKVFFHKRAQLSQMMLCGRFGNQGFYHVEDLGELTVPADYVLHNGLRNEGCLVYSRELAERVDKGEEIGAGSREEIEMRAATIQIYDAKVKMVNSQREKKVTAAHFDAKDWPGARKLPNPHLCKTIAY